eukprot:Filipodium_phascolosomae@DN1488_c0_g1_i1.p2
MVEFDALERDISHFRGYLVSSQAHRAITLAIQDVLKLETPAEDPCSVIAESLSSHPSDEQKKNEEVQQMNAHLRAELVNLKTLVSEAGGCIIGYNDRDTAEFREET